MKATDADKGVNGQVKYSIVQQPNQKGTKFTVDEDTGKIYTNKVRRVYLPGAVRRELVVWTNIGGLGCCLRNGYWVITGR